MPDTNVKVRRVIRGVTGQKPAPTPVKVNPAKATDKPKIVVAKPPPARKVVPRQVHDMESLYTGPSQGLNKRKSTTAIPVKEFGSRPDYVLTERTELIAQSIKNEFGGKPFERRQIDAGVLKYLGLAGHIEFVSGDPSKEDAVFKFTAKGLSYTRKVEPKKIAAASNRSPAKKQKA